MNTLGVESFAPEGTYVGFGRKDKCEVEHFQQDWGVFNLRSLCPDIGVCFKESGFSYNIRF